MKIIIFFVMNAFLIKENRDFPLIKDYHSNLQSSLSYFIFFPSFCYIWSSCNKEKNKPPFLMQKMSLKLRVKTTLHCPQGWSCIAGTTVIFLFNISVIISCSCAPCFFILLFINRVEVLTTLVRKHFMVKVLLLR